jgi:hypothetical protein
MQFGDYFNEVASLMMMVTGKQTHATDHQHYRDDYYDYGTASPGARPVVLA